jgi:hypothetical protein
MDPLVPLLNPSPNDASPTRKCSSEGPMHVDIHHDTEYQGFFKFKASDAQISYGDGKFKDLI